MRYVGSITFDKELLLGVEDIVIYGAGNNGLHIYEFLKRNGQKERVKCFIDKNKVGKRIDNKGVYAVSKACGMYPDALYLISGKYMKEMYSCLQKEKIFNIHMLFLA